MALFVATSGWLCARGMDNLRKMSVRTFHQELLNDGASDIASSSLQICTVFEQLPPSSKTGNPMLDLKAYFTDDTSNHLMVLDGAGAPAPGCTLAPELSALAEAGGLAAFFQGAAKGGPREITIDNHARFLYGSVETPCILHVRAYPDQNLILGIGKVQESTGIRLETFSDVLTSYLDTLMQIGAALYFCLTIALLTLLWAALQSLFFKPLDQVMATMAHDENTAPRERLTWKRLYAYARRVQEAEREKTGLRKKLEREIEVRFQAEEERDALQGNMQRLLQAAQQELQTQAAEEMKSLQARLMQREARMLSSQLLPGLEAAAASLSKDETAGEVGLQLTQCVNTVRALSHSSLGAPLKREELALKPWIDGIIQNFESARHIPVLANVCSDARASIDPMALGNALEFVMENAALASTASSAIRVDAVTSGNDIEIRVVDHGKGIPEEDRPHVFVPFFSAAELSDGLGLTITRSIVEQHGGSITLMSEADKGTAVIIRLPAA